MTTYAVAVCSLITGGAQTIPPGAYTTVRFPFDAESLDPLGMHTTAPPTGPSPVDASMPEAGLIWPGHEAWGRFTATMQWEDISELSSSYSPTHFRHRLIRDPLGYTSAPADTTATSDHLPRPAGRGRTCKTMSWEIMVHPGTPVAYQVYHDADVSMRLELAQFKLSYLHTEGP